MRVSLLIGYGALKLSQDPHKLTDRVVGGVRTIKVINVVVEDMLRERFELNQGH